MVAEEKTKRAQIGKVPDHWAVQLLSNFTSRITYGFTNPMPTTAEGPFMLTAKDVHDGRIDYANARRTSWDAYHNKLTDKSRPRVGDVLLTKDGSIGRVALCDRSDICINQSVAVLRPNEKIVPLFLKYLLETPHYQRRMEGDADGSTIKHIYITRVDKMEVAVPPLPEQKIIAAVLGALDDKIELNRRMNATLETMAQALFQSWFVDFDPVRAMAERRPPAGLGVITAAFFPAQFRDSDLGPIPQGWEDRPLYSTARFINGAAFKNEHFCAAGDGLPVIKIAELKDGIGAQTKFSTRQLDVGQTITTGDLLYSWSGNPDTSLDVFLWSGSEGLLNQHIFKVVPESIAEKRLIYYLLKYLRPRLVEIARDKQTTGLGHVTVADMKRIRVCWPSHQVLEAFDSQVGPLFDKAFANTLESQTLTKLRDALLPQLLSGELRPTNVIREVAV